MTSWETPLRFQHLEIRNRVIRASQSPGLEWELRFAEAGVGAIISPCVQVRGGCSADDSGASWPEHVARVQGHGCKYLLRLGQPSAPHRSLELGELQELLHGMANAARLGREAGADGVEIDAGHGSLAAQFLGPGVNDRPAEYQGSPRHRARLLREMVQSVRSAVGRRYHVQVRLGASSPLGMMVAGTLEVVRWLEEDGIDAIHLVPDGDLPGARAEHPFAVVSRFVKDAARVPVLRNGRFESEASIRNAIAGGSCDAVSLTRPLAPPRRNEVRLRPAA